MKMNFTLFSLIIAIQIFGLTNCNRPTTDWKFHSEKVEDKFIVEFKHPSNTVFQHIENGLCIGEDSIESGSSNEFFLGQDWCIWMADETENSIQSEIEYYRQNTPVDRLLEFDTTIVDNQEAIVLKTIDINSKKTINIRVYLNRFETLFSIYLHSDKVNQFGEFIETIKIIEIK